MDLEIQTKLILAFISEHNPLLADVAKHSALDADDEVKKVLDLVEVSPANAANWKNGGKIARKSSRSIFTSALQAVQRSTLADETKNAYKVAIEQYRALHAANERDSLHRAAALVGMGVDASQEIIDFAAYNGRPLFPGMFYEKNTKALAEAEARDFLGLYNVWLRRDDHWMQCMLRVRYVLQLTSGFAIRCKLNAPPPPNAPLRDGKPDYWEYDGFLAPRDFERQYWTLEQRGPKRGDFLYIVTERVKSRNEDETSTTLTLSGTYLTTDQAQRRIVAGDVLMERPEPGEPAEMERRLTDDPSHVRDAEACARINERWSAARARPPSQ